MKQVQKLENIYDEIAENKECRLFVIPQIRFAYKKTDYLYLLYKNLITSPHYPLTGLRVSGYWKLVTAGFFKKPSILHHHWLECTGLVSLPLFFYKLACIYLYKKFGGKLVWTIHNMMPPDSKLTWVNYKVRRWMAGNADLLHIQCASAIPEACTFFDVQEDKFRVVPHPEYPPRLVPRASAVEAINHRFGVNIKMQDRLFLMFGHISAYKGIEQVCNIFKEEPVQKKLIIAGPVKKGQMKVYRQLKKISRIHKNIILIPQFIHEESVPEFLNACDYVLFNFKDTITSGGVHLALSFDKKVILPDTECMRELENRQTQTFFFDSPEKLKEILKGL